MRFLVTYRFAFLAALVLSFQTPLLAAPDAVRSVTWEKITREEPIPGLDVDAAIVRLQRDAKRQGATPHIPSFRRMLERDRDGSQRYERQTWTTDGDTTRKDFSYDEPVALSAPAPPSPMVRGYILERGNLSVQVTTYNKPHAVRDADVNYRPEDTLFRTDEQGNALRLLLLGRSPEIFLRSPFVATRRVSPEGTVLTLKKKIPLRLYGEPITIPHPLRVTISRDGKRIIRVERLGYRDELPWETATPEAWSVAEPGLWLPGRIRVVSYDRSADGMRRVSRTETYRRVNRIVGTAVDVAPLHEPFFSGRTSVRDNRFDGENPDTYHADRNPLPENEARRRYEKRRREKTLSVLLPQLLGILAIGGLVIGLVLRIRRGDE